MINLGNMWWNIINLCIKKKIIFRKNIEKVPDLVFKLMPEYTLSREPKICSWLMFRKIRRLTLMPAVERIIRLFYALNSYFPNLSKCPMALNTPAPFPLFFLVNLFSEHWFYFVHKSFHEVSLTIEGKSASSVEV